MREHLGWFAFVLAIACGAGLVVTLMLVTWFGLGAGRGWAGFFGFGIPMLLTGLATFSLWENTPLLKVLGRTSFGFGFTSGLCIFLVVVSLVLSSGTSPERPPPNAKDYQVRFQEWEKQDQVETEKTVRSVAGFFGFGLLMLVTGAAGVGILRAQQPNS